MNPPTVGDLFALFVNTKRTEIRKTTLAKTTGILEHHVLPYFQKTRIDKLTLAKLQEWNTYAHLYPREEDD